MIGLFSSCDDTYEVVTSKTLHQWPCKNYHMQVVTTRVPKSSCTREEVMVNAGLSEPKQCNCRQEDCSVKISDVHCIKKNRECRKQIKAHLVNNSGKGSKLYSIFKNLSIEIDRLEDTIDGQFNKVELLRNVKDQAVERLNRTMNSLNVLRQKSLFANQSQINLASLLAKDLCIHENYLQNNGINFELVRISFNSKLPIINNMKLTATVRDSSGLFYQIPIIYDLMNTDATIKAASKKILYSIWCPHHVQRKRRSLNIGLKEIESDTSEAVLSFVSWDSSDNSSLAEKSCMTFKRTTRFLKDTVEQLNDILSQTNSTIGLIEKTSKNLEELKKKIKINNDIVGDETAGNIQTMYDSQNKILDSVSTEITGFRNRSQSVHLYKSWTESAEIYTYWNNLTVCLSFEDCIETALKSLEDIALVPESFIFEYQTQLKLLKDGFEMLLLDHFQNQTISYLTRSIETILHHLEKLEQISFHCSELPKIKPIVKSDSIDVIKGMFV